MNRKTCGGEIRRSAIAREFRQRGLSSRYARGKTAKSGA
jgi:hypothetical protein